MKTQDLTITKQNDKKQKEGYYGEYGGAFIPLSMEKKFRKT